MSVKYHLLMHFGALVKRLRRMILSHELGVRFPYALFAIERWQSGNAPDSKSGEWVLSSRAGSNPVLSL